MRAVRSHAEDVTTDIRGNIVRDTRTCHGRRTDGGQTVSDTGGELFQLDEPTCLALLGVHHIGRLIIPGDDPYVVPVNYTIAGGGVVFRTERRPVIDAIVDAAVVFEVDMFDDRSRSGWSVVLRGPVRDISPETDAERDAVNGSAPGSWAPGDRSCVLRIDADRLTGRLLRGQVAPSPLDEHGYL